jgi:hypothetical protein
LKAEREYDPIAIHYSQPSIQVAWLVESVEDGKTWPRRYSSFESQHSRNAAVRGQWLKHLQDVGYSPRFVSTAQIESGELSGGDKGGYRALIFPESWVVTTEEEKAMNEWGQMRLGWGGGWTMASSGASHTFWEHGILRTSTSSETSDPMPAHSESGSILDSVTVVRTAASVGADGQWSTSFESLHAKPSQLRDLPLNDDVIWNVKPAVKYPREVHVRTHRFRLGQARLLAFERNIDYHMSEDLQQAGGNEALETPVSFDAALPEKANIYDLRARKYLGLTDHIHVDLSPWKPSLYALLPKQLPPGTDVVAALAKYHHDKSEK